MSARTLTHLTASKGTPGSAGMAARSSRSASAVGAPERYLAEALMRSQPSLRARLSAASDGADGSGTSRLRRRKPTAFSTEPFSLPE